MKYELTCSIAASQLAKRIGARQCGADIAVDSVAAVDNVVAGSLTYWQSDDPLPDGLPANTCVIVRESVLRHQSKQDCCLVCRNPRLEFVRLLHWLGEEERIVSGPKGKIHPSAKVHPTAVIESGFIFRIRYRCYREEISLYF